MRFTARLAAAFYRCPLPLVIPLARQGLEIGPCPALRYTGDMLCVASWLTLQFPAWLALAFLTLGPVIAHLLARRAGRTPSTAATVLQSIALALLAVALARPALPRLGQRALPWLVLQDVSASLTGQRLTATPPAAEVVRFADALLPPGQSPAQPGTQLAPALQLAAARLAAGQVGGVILATDGRFTAPWTHAAEALASQNVPLLIVPLAAPADDARIASFQALRTTPGQASLRIDLAANAPLARTLTITPAGSTAPLARRKVTLQPDRPTSVHLTAPAPANQPNAWQATLTPADALPNDTASAVLASADRPIAWLAGPDDHAPPSLPWSIHRINPAEAPTTPAGWARYAAIVLPSQASLPTKARRALARATAMGSGLVLRSTAPHSPPDEPLTALAPLTPAASQRNPLDLVVLLDASGSMARPAGKRLRFDLARDGLLAIRGDLAPADRLAVWTFARDVAERYAAEPGEIDFARLAESIDAISPTGPTDIAPALRRLAQRSPARSATGLILVLSDQDVAPFDAPPLADALTRAGWTLAVVAAGPETQSSLVELAALMGGRARLLQADSLTGLGELFGSLIRTARGPAPQPRDIAITAESNIAALTRLGPTLTLLPTQPRTGSTVIARADGEPLAAVAPVGLGRAVQLALLPGSTNLPARAVRQLIDAVAPPGDPRYQATASRMGGAVQIDLDAPADGLALEATLLPADPAAEPIRAALTQVSPRRYRATLPLTADQAAGLVIRQGSRPVVQSVIPAGPGGEYLSGADWATLDALARQTGGQIVSANQLTSAMRRIAQAEAMALWPIALAGALAAMLLAWLIHRPT